MPAILDGDDAVRAWLDPSLTIQEVIHLLHPTACLSWYPVSNIVNNVRNKSPECVIKIDPRYYLYRECRKTYNAMHMIWLLPIS